MSPRALSGIFAAALLLAAAVARAETPPVPLPKPARTDTSETGAAHPLVPEEKPVPAEAPPLPPPAEAPPDPLPANSGPGTPAEACWARLAHLGVEFSAVEPIAGEGACGIARPVAVKGLAGEIDLVPPARLDCAVVEALARWVRHVVEPAAASHLGVRPDRLVLGSTYVCRNRVAGSGKLSEHALGNAVDVMAIGLEGREPLPVAERLDPEAPESRFQGRIREGACAYFTTVLGPGTDASHADHLHLDLRQRRRGYRLCQ